MNGLGKLVVVCLGSAAVAGCGMQLERAERVSPQGSAFDVGLYGGYLGLAKSETGEGDYRDSDTFATRAIAAGTGKAVGPEAISSRQLPAGKVGELSSARERLVAQLGRGAAQKLPGDAAEAQVKFDCWMQEQEEDFQSDHIAACRAAFYDALGRLESGTKVAEVAPKPAPKLTGAKFVVYFDTDSVKLDSAAQAVLAEAEAAAKKLEGGRVVVAGHADTVGDAAYNETLSKLRADAVSKLLEGEGVPASTMQTNWLGENNLAVPTADNVSAAENRRVEIFIAQ